MPIPFLVPAGMMAVRVAGKWVLKKIAKRAARKKLKELRKRRKARSAKTEKDLEYSEERPSPMITKTEAIARSNAKKEALVRTRRNVEDLFNPIRDEAIADLQKRHPQRIGGMGNAYGHGKGLGKKIERLTGTTKKSRQKERQYKRENKQVAKQRRQRSDPERRAVKRPKSGLYKDTPKKTDATQKGQKIVNDRRRITRTKKDLIKRKRKRELKEDAKQRRN